jgi:hypothetical protein
MSGPSGENGENAEDAEQWWQAYQLAERGQDDELRRRAAAGDEHARMQLATWLGDRGRTGEAIELIRPLVEAGDDIADRWLARWLAERGEVPELRQRAAAGSYPALIELADWLAGHGRRDELRALMAGHQLLLGTWLAAQGNMDVIALAAELGDEYARQRLDQWLARLRERAAAGSEYAREELAQWPESAM